MTKKLLLISVSEGFIYFCFSVGTALVIAFIADWMELGNVQTFLAYGAAIAFYMIAWKGGLTLFDGRERSLLRNRLFEERVISVFGDMKNEECGELALKIQYLDTQSRKPIICLIDSAGGDVSAFELLGNAIIFSKAPVIGIVMGRAFSSAALFLQTCHKRFMLPFSRLLFHECGTEIGWEPERMTASQLKQGIKFLLRQKRDMMRTDLLHFSMVCNRTGITPEQLKALYDRELFPEEAKKHGFIDGIIKSIDEAYQ